ncbi:MAG TPA: transglutaminase-like domain-containing protein [Bacillota bacterium]|nr:transglutaminase-like domain-containing protein [Bacillota bacterium]HOK69176.1 transglutaminase-like domain-containing protein [Bacillota bacterium]HPP85852.1 transglutaminase-like domain-containing protein [Bacillota bacterium]
MFDLYSGMLKMMDVFRDDGADVRVKYLVDADYWELKNAYPIEKAAEGGSDFDRAVNLLNWISSHIFHYGNYDNRIRNTALDLFDYAFDKGVYHGINCRSLSLAMTECLLALGMKARAVYIMPFSPYDFDNHVVCECWIKELNKWVMLDPTYNLYLSDKDGTPLDISELRQKIAEQEEVVFSASANYNGAAVDKDELLTYYAKDLFWFMLSDIQGPDSEGIKGRRMITIAPVGFDAKKCLIANIDFRIKNWGDSPALQNWRKSEQETNVIYKGIDLLK